MNTGMVLTYNYQKKMELTAKVRRYLLEDRECSNVHKIVWPDRAYVSSVMGRTEITVNDTFENVREIVLTHKAAPLAREIRQALRVIDSEFTGKISGMDPLRMVWFFRKCIREQNGRVEKELGCFLTKRIENF